MRNFGFWGSGGITQAEISEFVRTLNIEDSLPGISGIGFIASVDREDFPAWLDQTSSLGVPGLKLHPETQADELFIIQFIEPLEPNQEALGLDIAFESGRRTAATTARDLGVSQLTPVIFLVQDDNKQPGFLLLRPIYARGQPTETIEQRRAAHTGWVYAPFVGARTLAHLTDTQGDLIDIAVFDGTTMAQSSLIYDSAAARETADATTGKEPSFTETRTVPLFGQIWTFVWHSTPKFESEAYSPFGIFLLLSGSVVSLLLAIVVQIVADRGRRVRQLVDERTGALRMRERENRSILENAVVGIISTDTHGRIAYMNKRAQDILGISVPKGFPETIQDLLPEIDLDQHGEPLTLAHTIGPNEMRVLRVEVNRWRAAKKDECISILIQDVTDEVMSQKAIEATESRWNLALSGAQIGVFDVDLTTGKSVVSETWVTMMGLGGLSNDFDAQAHFLDSVHPQDLPLVRAADEAAILGETERTVSEYRIQVPGRGWRWMRSDGVVVERDGNGNATRLVGTQTDVTAIRFAQNALRASEDRFRLTFFNAPIGKLLLNKDFRVIDINEAMSAVLGGDKKKFHLNVHLETLIGAEAWRTVRNGLNNVKPNSHAPFRTELELQRGDGKKIWVQLNATRSRDAVSSEVIYILQMLDITEIRQMDRIRSEFVATVSHELRTPLTSIRGATGLLKQSASARLSAAENRMLDIALKNSERLANLVDDILDLEKVQSGHLAFDLGAVPLTEILGETIEELLPFAAEFPVKIDLLNEVGAVMVAVDQGRAIQCLKNLVGNACKFSARNGTVRIHAKPTRGNKIRVEVIDNGPGVPKIFESKLFTPFSQVDSSDTREKGGTGLGLNITKELMTRMGGKVGYLRRGKSETVFWLTFAIAKEASGAVKKRANRIKVVGDKP